MAGIDLSYFTLRPSEVNILEPGAGLKQYREDRIKNQRDERRAYKDFNSNNPANSDTPGYKKLKGITPWDGKSAITTNNVFALRSESEKYNTAGALVNVIRYQLRILYQKGAKQTYKTRILPKNVKIRLFPGSEHFSTLELITIKAATDNPIKIVDSISSRKPNFSQLREWGPVIKGQEYIDARGIYNIATTAKRALYTKKHVSDLLKNMLRENGIYRLPPHLLFGLINEIDNQIDQDIQRLKGLPVEGYKSKAGPSIRFARPLEGIPKI